MAGKTKADHLTGHEHSRQALEYSDDANQHSESVTTGHGIAAFGHDDIAALAYELWQARGCPHGSPQEDWFRAAEQLRSRSEKRFEGKRRKQLKPSTKDQIKGTLHEVKDEVKEEVSGSIPDGGWGIRANVNAIPG